MPNLSARLIRPHQSLVKVRYFTARINHAAGGKRRRQLTYLEAIETLPLVDIYYGTYLASPQTCFECGHTFIKHSEKKSDVNIAVKLITDAMNDLYDSAVLISADSDLTPALDAIKAHFPKKRVLLFFPPKRTSLSLKNACHVYCGALNKTTISRSQLPEIVKSTSGYPLKRPDHWT